MCGISCIVALHGDQFIREGESGLQSNAGELDQSLKLLRHRGPDATGKWISQDKRIGAFPTVHRILRIGANNSKHSATFVSPSMIFLPLESNPSTMRTPPFTPSSMANFTNTSAYALNS